MNETPSRPALRYHGSKWRLAPWIIKHIPPHELYCEPFGGAAAVLLLKPRSKMEVFNDLDNDVVNFFSVLRSHSNQLIRSIILTPFAKAEFNLSHIQTNDPIEAARRFYVRSYLTIAGPTAQHNSGWRRQKTLSARFDGRPWMVPAAVSFSKTSHLWIIAKRFKGVSIECQDALSLITLYNNPSTCLYLDPPYPSSTRSSWKSYAYAHEMTDTQHATLAHISHTSQSSILISSYSSPLYNSLYNDWKRYDKKARINGPGIKIESLWLNPHAQHLLDNQDLPLFSGVNKHDHITQPH